jgi:hypothetical protein
MRRVGSKQTMKASVGEVLTGSDEGKMYVRLEAGNSRLYFRVFDQRRIGELESLAGAMALKDPSPLSSLDGSTVTHADGSARFTWSIGSSKDPHAITGLTLRTQTPTSPTEAVAKVEFAFRPALTKVRVAAAAARRQRPDPRRRPPPGAQVSAEVLSTSAIDEAAPAAPYVFPPQPWVRGKGILEVGIAGVAGVER